MKMSTHFHQCKNFYPKLKHPEKYLREDRVIVARSGLEQDYFRRFDANTAVLRWNSENIAVPYKKPIFNDSGVFIRTENRHYYPDVYFVTKHKTGRLEEVMGEIKPLKQLYKPQPPKRKSQKAMKNYINSLCTWYVNIAKWESAHKIAEYLRTKKNRDIAFQILTENRIIKYETLRKDFIKK